MRSMHARFVAAPSARQFMSLVRPAWFVAAWCVAELLWVDALGMVSGLRPAASLTMSRLAMSLQVKIRSCGRLRFKRLLA